MVHFVCLSQNHSRTRMLMPLLAENIVTHETTWELPAELALAMNSLDAWVQHERDGRLYLYLVHAETGETIEMPLEGVNSTPSHEPDREPEPEPSSRPAFVAVAPVAVAAPPPQASSNLREPPPRRARASQSGPPVALPLTAIAAHPLLRCLPSLRRMAALTQQTPRAVPQSTEAPVTAVKRGMVRTAADRANRSLREVPLQQLGAHQAALDRLAAAAASPALQRLLDMQQRAAEKRKRAAQTS